MKSYSIYYTYIVQCADGTYYTGKTHDLTKRMKQHNGLLAGGAKYTRDRKPVVLVYYEEYETNKLAAQREYTIQHLTHAQKEALCHSFNR